LNGGDVASRIEIGKWKVFNANYSARCLLSVAKEEKIVTSDVKKPH
jgi:hypothetical protein